MWQNITDLVGSGVVVFVHTNMPAVMKEKQEWVNIKALDI